MTLESGFTTTEKGLSGEWLTCNGTKTKVMIVRSPASQLYARSVHVPAALVGRALGSRYGRLCLFADYQYSCTAVLEYRNTPATAQR